MLNKVVLAWLIFEGPRRQPGAPNGGRLPGRVAGDDPTPAATNDPRRLRTPGEADQTVPGLDTAARVDPAGDRGDVRRARRLRSRQGDHVGAQDDPPHPRPAAPGA